MYRERVGLYGVDVMGLDLRGVDENLSPLVTILRYGRDRFHSGRGWWKTQD